MDMQEFLGSNFLKATDYPKPALLTVSAVVQEEVGQDKERKVVLYFQDVEKGLILNKTNIGNMIDITGSTKSEQWIGKKAVIYTDPEVRYAGKKTPALRLRAPKQQSNAPVVAPPIPSPAGIAEEDEIPFLRCDMWTEFPSALMKRVL